VGTSADAHCTSCGYHTSLALGGGMVDHATYAAWPVVCDSCSAVTTANFEQTPLVCEECNGSKVIPMSDGRNWRGDGEVVVDWGELILTDGHYRCPKCGAFELQFVRGDVMWD